MSCISSFWVANVLLGVKLLEKLQTFCLLLYHSYRDNKKQHLAVPSFNCIYTYCIIRIASVIRLVFSTFIPRSSCLVRTLQSYTTISYKAPRSSCLVRTLQSYTTMSYKAPRSSCLVRTLQSYTTMSYKAPRSSCLVRTLQSYTTMSYKAVAYIQILWSSMTTVLTIIPYI